MKRAENDMVSLNYHFINFIIEVIISIVVVNIITVVRGTLGEHYYVFHDGPSSLSISHATSLWFVVREMYFSTSGL